MTTGAAKHILDASIERPLEMNPSDVVRELVEILGASLVALLGRAKNTRTVQDWIQGTKDPTELDRLRLALQVALFLQAAGENKDVVDKWMRGANRRLSDEAPAIVIADAPLDAGRRDVMAAARAFLTR